MNTDELQRIVSLITEQIEVQLVKKKKIPVGVSNRHLHLSSEDKEILFGADYKLKKIKDLKQPGQYACNELVTLKGPKGEIEKVRVLGPERIQTQVELSKSDCVKIGVDAPIRESGDLRESAPIQIIGPCGSLEVPEGAIIAQRHIHMSANDADFFGVQNGDIVSVRISSPRGGIYDGVLVRSGDNHLLEFHLDVDEANAMGIQNNDEIELIKNS